VSRLSERYGPWAVVAGASEGIGAAFATALAGAGLNVALAARRAEPLDALADWLRGSTGAEVRTVTADLGTPAGLAALATATAGLDVGLLVANAAYVPVGPFLDRDADDLQRVIDLNVTAPLRLARHYLPAMAGRGRGGLILMSSLAGQQGSPGITTYAATKAFGAVLAEGLWAELRGRGVDVLACVAGAVETPGLAKAKPRRAPGTVAPSVVVDAALRALGRRPRVVPGALMKVSSALMPRLLTRRAAIALIAKASSDLSG
jgi:short-subunit dehydrogenase